MEESLLQLLRQLSISIANRYATTPWDNPKAPKDLFVVDLLRALHVNDNLLYRRQDATYRSLVKRMFLKAAYKAKAGVRAPPELQTKHAEWMQQYNRERPQGMKAPVPTELRWLYAWMLEVCCVRVAVRRRISKATAVEELKRDVLEAQRARLEMVEEVQHNPHQHQAAAQEDAEIMQSIANEMAENDMKLFQFWEPLLNYLFAEFSHDGAKSTVKTRALRRRRFDRVQRGEAKRAGRMMKRMRPRISLRKRKGCVRATSEYD
ncbi:hypothetical protein PT974_05646 [Cladobotryum mycophilum]|uniref:Uncharacterized protein n=1 Tax=Cladobotryum mycophilum TaxID=491253 RepID=A0ABR0SJD1_9HYPO